MLQSTAMTIHVAPHVDAAAPALARAAAAAGEGDGVEDAAVRYVGAATTMEVAASWAGVTLSALATAADDASDREMDDEAVETAAPTAAASELVLSAPDEPEPDAPVMMVDLAAAAALT